MPAQRRDLVCPHCRTWFEVETARDAVPCPACGGRVETEADRLGASGIDERRGESTVARRGAGSVNHAPHQGPVPSPSDAATFYDVIGSLIILGVGLFLLVTGASGTSGRIIGMWLIVLGAWTVYETSGWRSYRHGPGLPRYAAQIPGLLGRAIWYLIVGLFFVLQCFPT